MYLCTEWWLQIDDYSNSTSIKQSLLAVLVIFPPNFNMDNNKIE